MEFPENYERTPDEIRTGEGDFQDLLDVMDRIRRNDEYINGSVNQEDASVSDAVFVDAESKVTIRIEPEDGKSFVTDEIRVEPVDSNTETLIEVDGDVSTDSNVLPFGVPYQVRKYQRITITNNGGSEKRYDYFTDAREVNR